MCVYILVQYSKPNLISRFRFKHPRHGLPGVSFFLRLLCLKNGVNGGRTTTKEIRNEEGTYSTQGSKARLTCCVKATVAFSSLMEPEPVSFLDRRLIFVCITRSTSSPQGEYTLRSSGMVAVAMYSSPLDMLSGELSMVELTREDCAALPKA